MMRCVVALLLLFVATLTGCASGPSLILVKNCKSLGSNMYQCEQIPTKDVKGGAKNL